MKEDKEALLPSRRSSNVSSDDEEYGRSGNAATDSASTKKRRSSNQEVTVSATSTSNKSSETKKEATPTAVWVKYTALFLLVAQTVCLVLLMRYSRTTRSPEQPLYLASTAVFFMEIIKLVVCLAIVAYQAKGALHTELYRNVIQAPVEMLKLTVPSLLYTVQNNLLYLALTNLDAATYQICYQLKILTTALFSALLLQRRFSRQKWLSLLVLTIGVAIVQVSGSGDQHSDPNDHHSHARNQQEDGENDDNSQNRMMGLVAVLCAACTSGFSGVYFEKILKGSVTSLWIRNVQMGLPSVVMAYVTIYVKDAAAIRTQGFLGGYSPLVWTVVSFQAVGGLIVATVVKYADNVLKVFAMSFSIVLSCIVSAFLFDFHPTWMFLCGASLVVTATVMYSSPEKGSKKKKKGSLRGAILPVTRTW